MTSIGEYLKGERELRQLSLEELSRTTRIPIKMLRHLEAGRFEELPGEVFVRGYVRAYARSLGVSAEDVIARYNQLNDKPTEVSAAPVTAITPPERGRRFGIAIALVILLILFTLALSIVLRPRRYDSSIELSLMRGLHQAPLVWAEPSRFTPSPPPLLVAASNDRVSRLMVAGKRV